jgi:hypothetical protein
MKCSRKFLRAVMARVVAGVLLIGYLAASIYDMTPEGNQLIQLMVLGAIALLFGDSLRQYRRQQTK